jgi:ribosome-binding factor A
MGAVLSTAAKTYLWHMSSIRLEKMSALIKREMAVIFQQNMRTMFGGVMITVTNVRVAPDLSLAKIYLSFFPTEKRAETLALVKDQYPALRRELGDKVAKQLRKIPELNFYLDDSIDYFEEIDRLLKKK